MTVRQRRRKQRLENALVTILVTLGALGTLLAITFVFALFGSIGIFLGWNLGVTGLAHAVGTHVGQIGYPTAFGASFAIGILRRILSGDVQVAKRV